VKIFENVCSVRIVAVSRAVYSTKDIRFYLKFYTVFDRNIFPPFDAAAQRKPWPPS